MKKVTLKAIEHSRWRNGSMSLAAIDESLPYNESIIGIIDLYDFDPLNQRCAVGIAVEAQRRHQGYATAMLKELTQFAKDKLSLHQLYADIKDANNISLRLFRNCGYLECGHMHDWVLLDSGEYADAYRMQIILN